MKKSKIQRSIVLTVAQKDQLQVIADKRGISVSDVIRDAIIKLIKDFNQRENQGE